MDTNNMSKKELIEKVNEYNEILKAIDLIGLEDWLQACKINKRLLNYDDIQGLKMGD